MVGISRPQSKHKSNIFCFVPFGVSRAQAAKHFLLEFDPSSG